MNMAELSKLARPEIKRAIEKFIEAGINAGLEVVEFEAACDAAIKLVKLKRPDEKVTDRWA